MFPCLNFILTVKTNLSTIKAGGSESLYSPWGGEGVVSQVCLESKKNVKGIVLKGSMLFIKSLKKRIIKNYYIPSVNRDIKNKGFSITLVCKCKAGLLEIIRQCILYNFFK